MYPHQKEHTAPSEKELIGLLLAFLEEQFNHAQSATWKHCLGFLKCFLLGKEFP